MAVQLIQPTDKLQSGFRAKYNETANEVITGFTDNGDGTMDAEQFDSTSLPIDFTASFFTKQQVIDLLASYVPGRQPVEYEFTEADLVLDAVAGSYYLPYKTTGGGLVPDGVRPYSISSVQGTHEYAIPALLENDDAWTEPRIYGFPDPATAQEITIFAI